MAVRCEAAGGRALAAKLRAAAQALLRQCGLGGCELSLALIDDSAMRCLNARFRGKDRATDVLSFGQSQGEAGALPLRQSRDPGGPPTVLGDIVISLETACRQARHLGVCPFERLRRLVIHGLLHLLGYDHEGSPAGARRMYRRERELLAALAARRRPRARVRLAVSPKRAARR
ncbi:MAG: rRNA maturation RNase YbeY [Deltaproteobacteria bacterium]|nr:rRNA maturation RNase YbeY [Deltaproteobacteria bacterium]